MRQKSILLGLCFALIVPSLALANAFPDTTGYEFENSITFLKDNEIVAGHPDGTYKPNDLITRAAFTKIIIESLYYREDIDAVNTQGCFPDVSPDIWYAKYACLAKEEGILQGYPNGEFQGGNDINQAEGLKIMYEAFYEPVEEVEGEWYEKYLYAAEYDGSFYFEPDNAGSHLLTRGEMAYFIAWNLSDYGQEPDQITPEAFYGEEFVTLVEFLWGELTPEDCYEDEYYDPVDKTCYLVEDSDYFQNLENEQDLSGQFSVVEHGQSFGGGEEIQVIYSIEGDEITLTLDQSQEGSDLADKQHHTIIWEKFAELIPVQNRSRFVEFAVFDDSEDSTLAYVVEMDDELETWMMAINLAGLLDESNQFIDELDFEHTLIHEFAHVMTLNADEVNSSISEDACYPEFFTGEGCAKENSFINVFFKKFWTNKMLAVVRDDPDYGGETLYEKNPDHFVTDYAATNPGEDIAESFTYFVMKPKPSDCQMNVQSEKICLFYDYPSLVKLRRDIRMAIEG